MRNQVSVFLALASCMLLGFPCESSSQACANLNTCIKRTSRNNYFFVFRKYSIPDFNSAIGKVCMPVNLVCLRNPRGCTDVKLVKQAQVVIKIREFLCSSNGREVAKRINQEDPCVGNRAQVKFIRGKYSECIQSSLGSMKSVDCKLITLVTVECTKDFTCCHMGGKYVVGDMGETCVVGHMGWKYVTSHMGGKYVVSYMGGKYVTSHLGGKYVVGHKEWEIPGRSPGWKVCCPSHGWEVRGLLDEPEVALITSRKNVARKQPTTWIVPLPLTSHIYGHFVYRENSNCVVGLLLLYNIQQANV
ncbi:hypothetical protein PoB_000568100 [Plakobranchus ocellatus]|uniref:Uncharacterized protein n=1 Tax=Plakobranchus ocellatus TaxID=259542 RepID=A0AAV3XW19_9GAST|nr:hypothetical protein PoB_000568100 [Plakobranchus ocellatus]